MNEVDIVIPVRITEKFQNHMDLKICVDSLVRTTDLWRLILVDDNSDSSGAAFVDEIARKYRTTMLIRTGFQRWWTRAVNLGLRMARTERVVVLNTDVVLDDGWLEELRACWSEAETTTGERVALVGSVMSDPEPRRWAVSTGQDYVTGHCWLVSMSALSEISAARGMPGIYLDETRQDMIHIRSDVQTCWELNRAGWQTIKSFKAKVGHVGGKSWGHRLGDINSLSLEQVSEKWVCG